MLFEFLINKEGRVSSVKESPAVWGKKERPPLFAVVKKDCSIEGALFIKQFCFFNGNDFIHLDSGEPFSEDMIIPHPGKTAKIEALEVADELSISKNNLCENFIHKFAPDEKKEELLSDNKQKEKREKFFHEERMFYYKTLFPLRNEPGIKDFLSAILYGTYGYIYRAAKKVPRASWIKFLKKLPPDRRAYVVKKIRK